MMKKRISFLTVLVLLLCLLTACRGGNAPATTVPMTTVPETQATTAPTTQATQATQPTADNGNGPLDTTPTDSTMEETSAPLGSENTENTTGNNR